MCEKSIHNLQKKIEGLNYLKEKIDKNIDEIVPFSNEMYAILHDLENYLSKTSRMY